MHTSVPPDVENSHVSDPTSSYTHRNPSGDKGDPVEPTAANALRSRGPSRSDTPSFMHEPMNAALVPKQLILVSAARSHIVPRSGYPGLPSNRMIDASVSSSPTRKFHIIQPVVVNQNIRSPAWASRWSHEFFSCSNRIPPWPWTIGFGSPVVPEL